MIALALCLALSACGRQAQSPVQAALDFRTALLAAERCTFSCDVSADYGRRVCEFALDCAYLPQTGGAELTVTAPETIAGIAARIDDAEAEVSFDGASLELGTLGGGHVAPMRLPQLLGAAWTAGYIESQAQEGDGCLVTYRLGYDSDELLCDTRFDAQMMPYMAELYRDGVCVLSAEIDNFSAAGASSAGAAS